MSSSDAGAKNTGEAHKAVPPIKLLTIHGSKGLEFDVVFLCGMEEGLLPHHYSILDETVDEERRLAYVALTRAKKKAYISYTKERLLWGRSNYVEPSRFLKSIVDSPDVLQLDPDYCKSIDSAEI